MATGNCLTLVKHPVAKKEEIRPMSITESSRVFQLKSLCVVAVLLAGVAPLEGCSWTSAKKNYYELTGTRPSQDIPENRRTPVLNAATVQGGAKAMESEGAKAIRTEPFAGASQPVPENQGFFGRVSNWFGGNEAKANYPSRRPIPGNPSLETVGVAPAPVAVEGTALPASEASGAPHEMLPEQMPPAENSRQAMIEEPVSIPEQQKAAAPPPQREDYPVLSNVPQTPEGLKAVRQENRQLMEELAAERSQAEHDKAQVEVEAAAEIPLPPAEPAQEEVLSSISDAERVPAPQQDAAPAPEPAAPEPVIVEAPAPEPAPVGTAAEPLPQEAPQVIAEEPQPAPQEPVIVETPPAQPPTVETAAVPAEASPSADEPIRLTPPETLFTAPTRFLPDSRYNTRRAATQGGAQ